MNLEFFGENLEQYGEEEYGEDDYCNFSKSKQKSRNEKLEKLRHLISERQEIRRKNIFLQKKMVEFFKRRKMDHVLKEDPKGLDLESKYLKRLFELQELKNTVNISKIELAERVNELLKETENLEESVKSAQADFIQQQKAVASGVTLKGDKKISARVVSSFLATQVSNANEINRLRLAEIKEKRILVKKQNFLKRLNNLEHGVKRADYEILKFQHENTLNVFESRQEEAKKCFEKSTHVSCGLNQVQKRAQNAERNLHHQKNRKNESNSDFSEAKFRLYKLQKLREKIINQQMETEKSSGLVTHDEMLHDFEKGLEELEEIWKKLGENVKPEPCLRFNTPETN